MSEAWEQIKQLKALVASLVAAAVVCMAIGGAIMEWRIGVNVSAALAAQDLGTDTKIVSMDTNIASNKRTGEENEEDIDQLRGNVEAAFRSLMGMPPPDTP